MRTFHERTADASRGKWRGILMELGVPASSLDKRATEHVPCPICPDGGGRDRFRFDDRDGAGTWICNRCGAGDGMGLAIKFTGQPFADVAARIDAIVGNVKPDMVSARPDMSDDERKSRLESLWRGSLPLEPDDVASRYLASRGLIAETKELRVHLAARDGEGGVRPCMVARVLTADGSRVATLHRTFLRPDGLAKAEMASPRKLMPGPVPDGAAIRLGPIKEAMGIAEGIETALAASMLFELPVWAAINTAMLEKWQPPEGVSEVCIFADNDEAFGGQAAAYALAHRLAGNVDVTVKLPPVAGQDFNDILLAKGSAA